MFDPSLDMDALTGADIRGWDHVLQSLIEIFTTRFGERVQREWFGSAVPRALGEPMNERTIVPFFSAIASAIEQWEPRFAVTKLTPTSVNRLGQLRVDIEGEYRPRALYGDLTPEGARRITVLGTNGGVFEVQDGN